MKVGHKSELLLRNYLRVFRQCGSIEGNIGNLSGKTGR